MESLSDKNFLGVCFGEGMAVALDAPAPSFETGSDLRALIDVVLPSSGHDFPGAGFNGSEVLELPLDHLRSGIGQGEAGDTADEEGYE